jgi:hypothetical protein
MTQEAFFYIALVFNALRQIMSAEITEAAISSLLDSKSVVVLIHEALKAKGARILDRYEPPKVNSDCW